MNELNLPKEGSPEYYAEMRQIEEQLINKFAWTAQHDGIIYKFDPAFKAMDDQTFNRVSRAEHSFLYLNKSGKRKTYFYRMQDVLCALDDPELDFGFIFAEVVEFCPGEGEITRDDLGRRVLNLWRAPDIQEQADAPEPRQFTDHISYLLDDDDIAINHVMDFIAHLVQRPHERVNHALLITSEAKGIGKSTLGTIIRKLVGERNTYAVQSKDLKSRFDDWLMGKLVVQVDEIYEHGNWDLASKLKPLITEPTVSVNVKYGPQISVHNFARFIIFSNHSAPIDIEEGDRRYFVFESHAQPRPTDYYDDLNAFIDSTEGLASIYSWLKQRDISAFRPYAAPPVTAAKQRIIGESGNPLRAYIAEIMTNGYVLEKLGPEFMISALQRLLHSDGYGQHGRNLKELSAALEAAGVTPVRVNIDGKRTRRWLLPDADGQIAKPAEDILNAPF